MMMATCTHHGYSSGSPSQEITVIIDFNHSLQNLIFIIDFILPCQSDLYKFLVEGLSWAPQSADPLNCLIMVIIIIIIVIIVIIIIIVIIVIIIINLITVMTSPLSSLSSCCLHNNHHCHY